MTYGRLPMGEQAAGASVERVSSISNGDSEQLAASNESDRIGEDYPCRNLCRTCTVYDRIPE